MSPQEIKQTCKILWNGPLLNEGNRNIFEEDAEIIQVRTGAPVKTKNDKAAEAFYRSCASDNFGTDSQKAAKLAEAEIVGKDKNGNPLYKFTQKSAAAERQARSRANRSKEGGKAFTIFLGPAEVEAIDKLKTKLGVDDASAIIKDAILSAAWSI